MSETASSQSEPDPDISMSEGYQTGTEQFYGSNSDPNPDTEALGQPTSSSTHLPIPQGSSLRNPFAASATDTQIPFAGQSTLSQPLFTFTSSDTQQTPFTTQSTPVQPLFVAPPTPSTPTRAHTRQAPFPAPSTPTGRPTVAGSPERTVRQGPHARGKRRALEDPPTPDPLQDFIHTAENHFATQNQQWSTVAEQMRQTTVALSRNSEVLGRLTTVLESNNERLGREERAKTRKQATRQMGSEQGSSNRGEHGTRKERVPTNHSEEARDDADDADNEVDNSTPSFKRPNPGVRSKSKKKATNDILLLRVSRISYF